MHLLIWFHKYFKVKHPHEVVSMISVEIPDPETHPVLYKLVCELIVHGPCGEMNRNTPCMKDGKCSKGFPKQFCEEITLGEDQYPKYHCHSEGRQHNVKGHMMDNTWVVPYAVLLLLRFLCHINGELTFKCEVHPVYPQVSLQGP